MTNHKRLDGSANKKTIFGLVLWIIVLILATAALFTISTPAQGQTRVPVDKQPHYLYQVQDGYLKQFTSHRDRYSCITTAAKIKLKPGTWSCQPS